MSDNVDQSRLNDFLKRLRHQAEPQKNDVRYRHYVGYINAFIGHFGKEKVFLVGSTAEGFKLRWSKDGGDADFILCSGMFEIPVENLVFREDAPCFVWVKADGLKSKIKFDLVKDEDTEYIPTDVLRTVSPDMFTILRGLYLIITSTLDTIPGRQSRVTTTALPSRVGLARTEYRNLNITDGRVPHPRDRQSNVKRRRTCKTHGKYGKGVAFHEKDKELMDAILIIITIAKKSESSGSRGGQFRNFAHVIDIVKRRRELGSEHTTVIGNAASDEGVTYVNDLSEDSDEDTAEVGSSSGVKRKRKSLETGAEPSGVKATYEEKTSKDFVPVIRVIGVLRFMVDWKTRGGFWPKRADRERIAEGEVFVVSRYAPVSPDTNRDFCLSFNQQELELARCMSETQRDVFLILKSFLKGGFQLKHNLKSWPTEMSLKTFHLKTAMYWVSEKEDPQLWRDDNIVQAVRTVLVFLHNAVEKTRLDHYFIPDNNLFAGMQKQDRGLIKECIEEAKADPISYINHFFNLDDKKHVAIELNENELQSLIDMKEDGGVAKEADVIEEAIIDFHKGFNAGPRDDDGNAPIVLAIKTTCNQFLDDADRGELAELQEKHELEKLKGQITDGLRFLEIVHTTNMIGVISDGLEVYNQLQSLGQGGATQALRMTGQSSSMVGSVLGTLATSVTGANPPTIRGTQEQPDICQQGPGSSQEERAGGEQLLAGAVNFLINRGNMDRDSRRRAEGQLLHQGLSFFLKKPF